MKSTQATIDELLGTELLGEAVFFGQNDVLSLLESTDREFKAKVGKMVDLAVWQQAEAANRRVTTETGGVPERGTACLHGMVT